MPRREEEPIDRFHVHLYRSDVEWLKSVYGDNLGVAKAVRKMVRGFRNKVEAKVTDHIDEEPREEVSLDNLGV